MKSPDHYLSSTRGPALTICQLPSILTFFLPVGLADTSMPAGKAPGVSAERREPARPPVWWWGHGRERAIFVSISRDSLGAADENFGGQGCEIPLRLRKPRFLHLVSATPEKLCLTGNAVSEKWQILEARLQRGLGSEKQDVPSCPMSAPISLYSGVVQMAAWQGVSMR